jgi:RimJ/RimL family protein N-acetyltransferase
VLTFASPSIGDRLLLRPFQASDVDDVHRFQSDPAVLPYIPWPVRTRRETSDWLAERAGRSVRQEGDHAAWAVERLADHRVIGSVNLTWTSSGLGQAEFGLVLARDVQGFGYAAEATTQLLDAAFPALGLHRAYGRVDARNEPSLRMLRRLGLRQEAHLLGAEELKGERVDVVVFAILADEWTQLRRPQMSVPRAVMATQDDEQIAELLRTLFAAFTSGPDVAARLDGLRAVFLPAAVIVKTCGAEPTVYDVDAFIAPRQALLSAGDLQEFREWEVHGQTQVFGDIAQHFCTYAKSWVQEGEPVAASGMKTIQLIRTGDGWRISALAWDDAREGLTINDPAARGGSDPAG